MNENLPNLVWSKWATYVNAKELWVGFFFKEPVRFRRVTWSSSSADLAPRKSLTSIPSNLFIKFIIIYYFIFEPSNSDKRWAAALVYLRDETWCWYLRHGGIVLACALGTADIFTQDSWGFEVVNCHSFCIHFQAVVARGCSLRMLLFSYSFLMLLEKQWPTYYSKVSSYIIWSYDTYITFERRLFPGFSLFYADLCNKAKEAKCTDNNVGALVLWHCYHLLCLFIKWNGVN